MTLTIICVVAEQPLFILAVTVYVVFIVALVITEAPVVTFNPVEGDQVYVEPEFDAVAVITDVPAEHFVKVDGFIDTELSEVTEILFVNESAPH
jgi:hypothetical protein